MSWPPTSKLHRRCFSSWMPQESRNNLVQQKKQKKKNRKKTKEAQRGREREWVCVCVGGEEVCLACRPSTMQLPHNLSSCDGSIVLSARAACTDGGRGFFFFFKPIHPPHQHINMQSMPAYASAARTSVAGCQTESEESAEMWEWHSKCENPLIRQSGDMWCDLCTIYVCHIKECEYTNVFAWKFLGKPRGKKKKLQ